MIMKDDLHPDFRTSLGSLYCADALTVLSNVNDHTFDVIFADPPFNLNKIYPSAIDDNLASWQYISWCESWLSECIRTLKDGGSLFIWNLPKWNTYISGFLNKSLTFRNWITVDIKCSLPIKGRLYPSHYSLLYYCKGKKPKTFHPDRMAMELCPKCLTDLKDYGGYKHKMNPEGVNLSDVWHDIPPVRHHKYKRRKDANELSLKLLDRVIEMSSDAGDFIFDPFGGSGTTYIAAELKGRRWIGTEIGPIDDIVSRFENIKDEQEFLSDIRSRYNKLFQPDVEARRSQLGLWTCGSVRKLQAKKEALRIESSMQPPLDFSK